MRDQHLERAPLACFPPVDTFWAPRFPPPHDARAPPLPPSATRPPIPPGDQIGFARRRAQQFLADVDNAGFWSVGSGLLALNTFLLETVNEERFGGWDILYRDDINVFYYGLSTRFALASGAHSARARSPSRLSHSRVAHPPQLSATPDELPPAARARSPIRRSSISYLENVTTFLFFAEFIMRAWCALPSCRRARRLSIEPPTPRPAQRLTGCLSPPPFLRRSLRCADDLKKFWTSPFTWIDGVSALPALLAFAGVDYKIQRICRLLRVLRLLRLLEREPDSVLFGVMQSDNMSVQLIGVAAEFVCIFCVSAGVIFDLEYGVNENVHTLADTLYWAFLTLTGIGQPFEIQTPAGKIATVASVLVALVVVPGQLAKLAAASSGRMMMEAMIEEEQAIANDFQIGAGVRVPRPPAAGQAQGRGSQQRAVDKTKSSPASAVGMMGQMGRVGAELAAQEAARVMAGSTRVVTDTGAGAPPCQRREAQHGPTRSRF